MQDMPEAAARPDGRPDGEPGAEPILIDTPAEDPLARAEAAAREHHDAYLRARAEAENIRKRAQTEIANAHKFALESFAAELLPVRDSLEAALAAENASVESMKSGVELTLKQLAGAFERFSLVEVNPVGQKFDPHRHEAISTREADAEPNTVLQVLQKGYLLHQRVVRPALVIVAKGVEK
ncbi:MAG: nucleotide exchange factor GrpE [Burkholderiales bacterium]|nr:nucleotide exchange factor GrpE [Burkholderiales bacterium]